MKRKIIVVVDIQREYGEWFSYSYLKAIAAHLNKEKEKGHEIITMIEPSRDKNNENLEIASIPDFLMEVSDDIGYKIFDEKLIEPLSSSDKKFVTLYDDKIYPVYMSRIFEKLCNYSKEEVYFELVGGGYTKCLNIVYHLLQQEGFEVIRHKHLCYDIRYVNSNRHENIFEQYPPKSIQKKFLNADGTFRCTLANIDKKVIELLQELAEEYQSKYCVNYA